VAESVRLVHFKCFHAVGKTTGKGSRRLKTVCLNSKMQLEAADYAPVLPPGNLDQTTLSDVQLVLLPGERDET